MRTTRKHPAIDLLELYTKHNTTEWNAMLSKAFESSNVGWLERTLYGVQAGMDDLVKKKLNTKSMNIWFIRVQRSLERTARDVYRRRHPCPTDDPLSVRRVDFSTDWIDQKKARDQAFEQFLIRTRY